MIYLNFSAKTLKTILTRLQLICICFTKMDEKKTLHHMENHFEQNQGFSPKGISYEWPLTLPNKLQTLNSRGP